MDFIGSSQKLLTAPGIFVGNGWKMMVSRLEYLLGSPRASHVGVSCQWKGRLAEWCENSSCFHLPAERLALYDYESSRGMCLFCGDGQKQIRLV
jgi:hypothetical protein